MLVKQFYCEKSIEMTFFCLRRGCSLLFALEIVLEQVILKNIKAGTNKTAPAMYELILSFWKY